MLSWKCGLKMKLFGNNRINAEFPNHFVCSINAAWGPKMKRNNKENPPGLLNNKGTLCLYVMLLVAFSCFSCCWLLGFPLRFLPVIIISSACTPGLTEEDYAASAERCHTHKLANVLLSNQTGPCREMGATQRAAAKSASTPSGCLNLFPPSKVY